MKPAFNRLIVQSFNRFNGSTVQRGKFFAWLLPALFFTAIGRADFQLPGAVSARSVSGQFVVVGARQVSSLAGLPAVATNSDFVRLDPALLAVSAERVKNAVWRALGVSGPWRGQIYLAVHPARSLDETVTVVSSRLDRVWCHRVELPDVVRRMRLARALTGVVLLELADRDAGERSAELPGWLVDGLARQLLASSPAGLLLSTPAQTENHVPENRLVAVERGVDPLASARRVLQDRPALTFDQLSWPTAAQVSGADGGVYQASAQLFVSELLGLKDGPARLRAMLAALPQFYNWQLAFRAAFRPEFPTPLDVEKWWALRVVSFAARDAGPQWTSEVSRRRLDEILSVPVEIRSASNNLPVRAEVSLQAVIRNFDAARQTEILQTKLRDLELAQLRMAGPFAVLNDQYRRALADYLGAGRQAAVPPRWFKHPPPLRAGARETLKKLDALDAQRRALEAKLNSGIQGG